MTVFVGILVFALFFYMLPTYTDINRALLIVAVLAIYITWIIHESRQLSMLEACLQEVELIIKDSNGFKEELEKNNLPLYFMKEISAVEFAINLDARINIHRTIPLKQKLYIINDKVRLINGYLRNMLNDYFIYLRNRKYKNEKEAGQDFRKNSKIYAYLLPKLNGIIPDLDKLLSEARCILKERFIV